MDKIVVFKLVTSEWIVGKHEGNVDEDLMLEQVLAIHIVPKGPQTYGLALVPFDPTNPEGMVRLNKNSIVAQSMEVAKGLSDAYLKQTTSIEIVQDLGNLK